MSTLIKYSNLTTLIFALVSFTYQGSIAQCDPSGITPALFCSDAEQVCLQDACFTTTNMSSQGHAGFCGPNTLIHNPQYFVFVPVDTVVQINIIVNSCTSGAGLQAAIIDISGDLEDCGEWTNDDVIACDPNFSGSTSMFADVTVGQLYLLVVDGSNSATCQYSITQAAGVEEVGLQSDISSIEFDFQACAGDQSWSATVSPPVAEAHGYRWQGLPGGTVFSNSPTLSSDTPGFDGIPGDAEPGEYTVCVRAFSGCDTGEVELCFVMEVVQLESVEGPDAHYCLEEFERGIQWGALTINSPGTYTTSFQTTNGCVIDSIKSFLLLESGGESSIDTLVCGSEFSIYDSTLTADGQYVFTFPTGTGCDSNVIVNLEFYDLIVRLTSIFCSGDSAMTIAVDSLQASPDTSQVILYWLDETGDTVGFGSNCTVTGSGAYTAVAGLVIGNDTCILESPVQTTVISEALFQTCSDQVFSPPCDDPDELPTTDCEIAPLSCLLNSCFTSSTIEDQGHEGWCGPQSLVNNPQYFLFIAVDTVCEITLVNNTCPTGPGLQAAIIDIDNDLSTCSSWENDDVLSCNSLFNDEATLTAFGVDSGSYYLLLVDGANAAVCEYTISHTAGIFAPGISGAIDTVIYSSIVCPGDATWSAIADPPVMTQAYRWLGLPGGTVYTSTPILNSNTPGFAGIPSDALPGTYEVCVQPVSNCDDNGDAVCFEIEVLDGVPDTALLDTFTCDQVFQYEDQLFIVPGEYYLIYEGASTSGCDSIVLLNINKAELDITLLTECQDDSLFIVATINNIYPPDADLTFTWRQSSGQWLVDDNTHYASEADTYLLRVLMQVGEDLCAFPEEIGMWTVSISQEMIDECQTSRVDDLTPNLARIFYRDGHPYLQLTSDAHSLRIWETTGRVLGVVDVSGDGHSNIAIEEHCASDGLVFIEILGSTQRSVLKVWIPSH